MLSFSSHQVREQIQKQNLHISPPFHKHTNCQPVNQLPDGRQMSLGNTCQNIHCYWLKLNRMKWIDAANSIPRNAIADQ